MNWFTSYQDFSMLLVIPLMVTTALDLKKNWPSVWDDELTDKDRQILLRSALFLLMPVAVFLHELGHAWATIVCGGQVAKFHYGILWGYVVPSGTFTELQLLLIYLAGNVVEVVLGLLVLCLVPLVSSPPLISLLVYFGLWTVAATIIFYPALSLVGMYGDWIAIYTSPLTGPKVLVASLHLMLVGLMAYLVYGKAPRLWYVRRTERAWNKAYLELMARIKEHDDPEDYLRLAWLYYDAGLNAEAQQFVTKFVSRSSHTAESKLLQGLLLFTQGKTEQALGLLQEITGDEELSPGMITRRDAVLALLRKTGREK